MIVLEAVGEHIEAADVHVLLVGARVELDQLFESAEFAQHLAVLGRLRDLGKRAERQLLHLRVVVLDETKQRLDALRVLDEATRVVVVHETVDCAERVEDGVGVVARQHGHERRERARTRGNERLGAVVLAHHLQAHGRVLVHQRVVVGTQQRDHLVHTIDSLAQIFPDLGWQEKTNDCIE